MEIDVEFQNWFAGQFQIKCYVKFTLCCSTLDGAVGSLAIDVAAMFAVQRYWLFHEISRVVRILIKN